jgi:hypothetical protein
VIIEIALASAAVALASAVARAVAVRRAERAAGERARRDAADTRTAPRGLRVGDVLLHIGDELWLAGMIELDEEGSRIRLFRAPENARASWVAQLDDDARELALLSESDELPEGGIPDRLPIGGRVLSLERRGRARVRGTGERLPPIAERARFTVLGDAGGRVAIVVELEGAPRLTLLGDRVDRALFDLLPGGDV